MRAARSPSRLAHWKDRPPGAIGTPARGFFLASLIVMWYHRGMDSLPKLRVCRCQRCGRKWNTTKRKGFPWCYTCYQEDPEGAQLADRRGTRSGWLNKMSSRQLGHDCIVYAVHLGGNRVKVGHTVNLKNRLGSYRVIVPHCSAFWGTWCLVDGQGHLEGLYHERLDRWRVDASEVFTLGNMQEALIILETVEDGIRASSDTRSPVDA